MNHYRIHILENNSQDVNFILSGFCLEFTPVFQSCSTYDIRSSLSESEIEKRLNSKGIKFQLLKIGQLPIQEHNPGVPA